MLHFHTERKIQAEASFKIGNRVFHVVSEVLTTEAYGGKLTAIMVSPIALLVNEEGRLLYSISLTGPEISVEEILRFVPSLKEKIEAFPRLPD